MFLRKSVIQSTHTNMRSFTQKINTFKMRINTKSLNQSRSLNIVSVGVAANIIYRKTYTSYCESLSLNNQDITVKSINNEIVDDSILLGAITFSGRLIGIIMWICFS